MILQRIAALSLLMLAGCVTHAPMSEMTMFRDPATPVRHEAYYTAGLTATASLSGTATAAWMRKDHAGYAAQSLPYPRALHTGGLYLAASDSMGNVGLSLTLTLLPGADVTTRLYRRNYLTVGYSAPDLFQVYLQHRALNTSVIGATVGFGARSERLYFDVPCEGWFCSEDRRVYSVGARGLLFVRDRNARSLGYKVIGYVGYVPYVNRPVMSLTLSLGGV